MKNNFKELENIESEEASFDKDVIKNGIESDMKLIRFITSIVEMYFPKVASLFVSMSGGEPDEKKENVDYPDLK